MAKTLSVGLVENSQVKYVSFNLRSPGDIEIFCDDLALYIIDKYTNYLFGFIINKNYGYLSKTDKLEIYKTAKSSFSKIRSEILPYQKKLIMQSLYRYFFEEGAEAIVLEGFVRFRLGSYMEELEFLVDRAVDEFFLELEYKNFIKLLQEFLATQKPKIQLVHIKTEDGRRYCVCDENFEELSASRIFELTNETDYGVINEDDLLLSNLINLAPRKIIIHNKERIQNKQLYETINTLFAGRIHVCDGCERCGM